MTHWATYTGITNQLWDRGLINVTVKSIRIADIGGGQVQMCSECQVEARVMLKDLLLRFSLTSTYEKVVYSSINLFATRKPNQRLWTDCMNGMHRVELFIRTTLCFNRLATVFGSWNPRYSMSLRQPFSRDNMRCVWNEFYFFSSMTLFSHRVIIVDPALCTSESQCGNRYVWNFSHVLQIIESFFFTFFLSFIFAHTLHQVFAALQSVHNCFCV